MFLIEWKVEQRDTLDEPRLLLPQKNKIKSYDLIISAKPTEAFTENEKLVFHKKIF